jgi:hypothetical protein
MAAPAVTLAPNALVDVATVEGAMSLTSSGTVDAAVTRIINAVSMSAEQFCGRKFSLGQWTDLLSAKDPGPARLVLRNPPVWQAPFIQAYAFGTAATGAPMSLTSDNDPGTESTTNADQPVTGGGQAMAFGTDYFLEDSDAGFLYRQDRWWPSAIRQRGVVQDFDALSPERSYQCAYVGGYLTIPLLSAAAAWTQGNATLLQLVIPAAHSSQLWICALAGTTGTSEPSWPASPAVGATVTDGAAIWTYIGSQSQPGSQPGSAQSMRLPWDLEAAIVEWASMLYRRIGQSLEPSSEKFLNASQTYSSAAGSRIWMPASVERVLTQYRTLSC